MGFYDFAELLFAAIPGGATLRYVCLGCWNLKKYCIVDQPHEFTPPDQCTHIEGQNGEAKWMELGEIIERLI